MSRRQLVIFEPPCTFSLNGLKPAGKIEVDDGVMLKWVFGRNIRLNWTEMGEMTV